MALIQQHDPAGRHRMALDKLLSVVLMLTVSKVGMGSAGVGITGEMG